MLINYGDLSTFVTTVSGGRDSLFFGGDCRVLLLHNIYDSLHHMVGLPGFVTRKKSCQNSTAQGQIGL